MRTTSPEPRACRFTLIELLACIAIIAVLIALLMPVLGRARQAAMRVVCVSNIRQQTVALHLYVDEQDSRLPAVQFNTSHPPDECRWPINTWIWRGGIGEDGTLYNWGIMWQAGYITDQRILYDYIDYDTIDYRGVETQYAPWGTGTSNKTCYHLNPYQHFHSDTEREFVWEKVPEDYMLSACLFGSKPKRSCHGASSVNLAFRDGAVHAVDSRDAGGLHQTYGGMAMDDNWHDFQHVRDTFIDAALGR